MTKLTITADQEDQVVIAVLQDLHQSITDNEEGSTLFEANPELLNSIEHVLSYFMAPRDYRNWKTVVDNRTAV